MGNVNKKDFNYMITQITNRFGYTPKYVWDVDKKVLTIKLPKGSHKDHNIRTSVFFLQSDLMKNRLALVEKLEFWYNQ